MFYFDPSEHIRKPLVFWSFGIKREELKEMGQQSFAQ